MPNDRAAFDAATIIDNLDTALEEVRTLLERTSTALDYMEDRGFSSQRVLASDVMEFRRRMGWMEQPGKERPV